MENGAAATESSIIAVPEKIRNKITVGPNNMTSGYTVKRTESRPYGGAPSSSTHGSRKVGAAQVSLAHERMSTACRRGMVPRSPEEEGTLTVATTRMNLAGAT